MPPAGPSQGGEADNSLAALWITIGLFALIAFIWFFLHAYIVHAIFLIRSYEADLISFILPSHWTGSLNKARQFIDAAQVTHYQDVTYKEMAAVSDAVGNYLRFPVALILVAFAVIIFMGNTISRFKKTYSMESLRAAEREMWPQITPITKLNLVHDDLDKGPWAMSLGPVNFAKKHKILIVEKLAPNTGLKSRVLATATINRDDARKIFAVQVGPYWVSPENLPVYIRALFGIFAARVAGEREEPNALLLQIATSTASGKLNFAGTDKLLKKHKDNPQVQKLIKRHAFVFTVMASLLELAREDGVLPSSDFLWLKPVDRRLWFMLNSVGRQTPFPEIAGPFAHWLAEKEIGRALNVPMVEEAVNGLAEAMKEFIYKPDEDEANVASE